MEESRKSEYFSFIRMQTQRIEKKISNGEHQVSNWPDRFGSTSLQKSERNSRWSSTNERNDFKLRSFSVRMLHFKFDLMTKDLLGLDKPFG